MKIMGKGENDLKKVNFPLMGFTSTTTYPVGAITLLVYFGKWNALTINVTFIMIDTSASYNAILGNSTLNPHRMIHSTYHQFMKFPTPHGIRIVRGDQPVARNRFVHSIRRHILKKKEDLSIQIEEDLM